MSRKRLSMLLALGAGTSVLAQPGEEQDGNLFGDGIVRKLSFEQGAQGNGGRLATIDSVGRGAPSAADGAHLLIFHDGRQLRGEIVALSRDEIIWRRAGVSEPLRLAREEVQSIVLSASPEGVSETFPELPGSPDQAALEKSAAATIKLGGADWLLGDVTSADGQTFACRLDGSTAFQIPRAQIDWLFTGAQAAPAFALAASGLGLAGWESAGGAARIEVAGETMVVRDAAWLGRTAVLPTRFEVSFAIPAEAEEGMRLWLQPYSLQPNSYSFGTIALDLGPAQLARHVFLNGFVQKTVKIARAAADTPPVYRVFYDAGAGRLAVVRNGELLGDWKFSEERKVGRQRAYTITGICFDRENPQPGQDLVFHHLEVRPWNGLLPEVVGPVPDGDLLSFGAEPPQAGRLEALSEKDLVLSGTTRARVVGIFAKFPQRPAALADASAALDFGAQGELSAADLEIHGGMAHCRTVFDPSFTAPVASLKTIAFLPRAAAPPAGDRLVFKNGDELPGALLFAAPDGPLRWRTLRGQEIEVALADIAGVLFAAGRNVPPEQDRATIELRNGDRLRGALEVLDGTHLRLRHAHLGAVGIARDSLWRLYPNPQLPVRDGACNLDAWLGKEEPPGDTSPFDNEDQATVIPWIHLDGRFALRPHGARPAGWTAPALKSAAGRAFERFELRFDITSADEDQPDFNLVFEDKSRACSVQVSFSDGELHVFALSPNEQNAVHEREVVVNDKLTDPTSRLNVRAFVNRVAGCIDFLIDGVPVAQVGRQKAERIPGIGAHLRLRARASESAVVISNLWLGPWNGELPSGGGEPGAVFALANGDMAAGTPAAWREGKLAFDSDIGPLELPLAAVQAVEFGGALTPERAVARVHLSDGSAVTVDTFRWDGHELTAHSPTTGELRLAPDAVSELVFRPPVVSSPRTSRPKKLAREAAAPAE